MEKINNKNCNTSFLVMTELHGWQWGVGLEFILFELEQGRNCEVLDLSFVGERFGAASLKNLLGGYKLRRASIKHLKSKKIKVIKNRKKFFITRTQTKNFIIENSIIHNSLCSKLESIDLDFIKNSWRGKLILRNEIISSDRINQILTKLDRELNMSAYQKIVTVNGRFTKSATVIKYCKDNKYTYGLLEGGGLSKSSFQLFNVSPHSMGEIQEKIDDLWRSALSPTKELVAEKFIRDMVQSKSIPGVNFRSKMKPNLIPKIGAKKVCVFYASSEFEWIGVADPIPHEYFQNQQDSFRALVKLLEGESWDIFLRRHPKSSTSKVADGESSIWHEFKELENVNIIGPESPIDSIALGLEADLIASFWSSINMEFMARGLKNVINLGPAAWNRLVPENYLPTTEKIQKFLNNEPNKAEVKKLYPWAYYQAEAGNSFKIIETYSKTGIWKIKKLN